MSWDAVASMGLSVRPWAGSLPERGHRPSLFSSPLRKTLLLLARELEHLGAAYIVIELAIRERDLRLDGFPRADARVPEHPCVAVSFESEHGPLRYATGEFNHWEDNLRAVALSLESLRAVDRYGVSKRGEQYRGWRALEAGDGKHGIYTEEQAAAYLRDQYGRPEDGDPVVSGLRRGLFVTHPDRGGNVNEFYKVMRAKEVLAGAA